MVNEPKSINETLMGVKYSLFYGEEAGGQTTNQQQISVSWNIYRDDESFKLLKGLRNIVKIGNI